MDAETDEQSIIREFEEEFGVKVSVDKKIAEATFKHNGDDFSLHAYLIHLPHDGMTEKFALTEHTEYRWAELAEIPTLNFVDFLKLLICLSIILLASITSFA